VAFITAAFIFIFLLKRQVKQRTREISALQQKAEENTAAIAEREQLLADILEGTLSGYWDWNIAENTEYLSPAFKAMFGYEDHEMESSPEAWQRIIFEEDLPGVLEVFDAHIQSHGTEPFYNEIRYHHKNGSTIWVICAGRAIEWDENGSPVRMVGCHVDITRLKEMEEQLRQAEKMNAIGQLAGGVAHDFNNQLAGVLGYADMLAGRITDEKLLRFVTNIRKGATRAADLTRQLLAFSRKGKHLTVPVDINRTLNEVCSILAHSIDKRIELRLDLQASPATAAGDPNQLQNAFLNLALNARDAMPDGGTLTFETSLIKLNQDYCRIHSFEIPAGPYIKVSISDTGTGMDATTRKRIFEPFFTTKGEGKGTGMGLASVFGTISNHNGAITVYSEPNHGTVFHVYLPFSEKEAHDSIPVDRPLIHGSARILLVDDEEMVRALGGDMLQELGYSVINCADGEEAVAYYQEHWQEIDLVILDMVMPRRNGRDTFRAMREINPEVKAILSSGYSINGEAQAILSEGVMAFVGKPFEQTHLSSAVAESLGTR
jgi:PAS domain S-box-containing protein